MNVLFGEIKELKERCSKSAAEGPKKREVSRYININYLKFGRIGRKKRKKEKRKKN